MDIPAYDKLLIATDAAINIQPTLKHKRDICQNAVDLLRRLGMEKPKVTVLTAVETVNPKMPATARYRGADRDGRARKDHRRERRRTARLRQCPQLGRRPHQGHRLPVAGEADILLVPDPEADNMPAKQLIYFAGATAAGLVPGARVPIVPTGRADPVSARSAPSGGRVARMKTLLTFNAGSSTVKIGLFALRSDAPLRISRGIIDFRHDPLTLQVSEGEQRIEAALDARPNPDLSGILSETLTIPRTLHDRSIKRYGFHGLSYKYVAGELAHLAPEKADGRVVVARLGSGASLCGLDKGTSRDTSMGFSTLGVLPWRRAAALDPGVLLHLLEQEGLALREMEDLLYHKTGLLGGSGIMGSPAVLAAIAVVVAAQLVFTIAPFLHELFGTTPIALLDGLLILTIDVITMAVLECEKAVVRKVWSGSGNGDGRSGLAEA